MSDAREAEATEVPRESVRAVRLGHGANCSSVGSVVDTLFVAATVGGAMLAAVLAAMSRERVKVVGDTREGEADAKEDA
ncbi:MAG: hypothetical protein KF819_40520 [Labilithrix sp.]|nr:hypothetical protein [Labilithrix sp.]